MSFLPFIGWFFGGALLANAVPHLVAGLMGRAFQTPFAKPRGKGLSSSRTNILWGFVNLMAAWMLFTRAGDFDIARGEHAGAALAGALMLSLYLSRAFGSIYGGYRPDGSSHDS